MPTPPSQPPAADRPAFAHKVLITVDHGGQVPVTRCVLMPRPAAEMAAVFTHVGDVLKFLTSDGPAVGAVRIAYALDPLPAGGVSGDDAAYALAEQLLAMIDAASTAPGKPLEARVRAQGGGQTPPWTGHVTVTVNPDGLVMDNQCPALGAPVGPFRKWLRYIEHGEWLKSIEGINEAGEFPWVIFAMDDIYFKVDDFRTARRHSAVGPGELKPSPLNGAFLVELGLDRWPPQLGFMSSRELSLARLYAGRMVEMAGELLAPAAASPGTTQVREDAAWGCSIKVTYEPPPGPVGPIAPATSPV